MWRWISRLPYTTVRPVTRYLESEYEPVEPSPVDDDREVDHDNLGNGSAAEGRHSNGDAYFDRSRRSNVPKGRGRLQWYILFLCATIAILTEFGEFLSSAPQTEIFLQIACNAHYASTGDKSWQNTSGGKCRVEPVQTELALVDGWKETFDQLPGIILAIPYGILADRIGRKPILLLGAFGILMSEIFVRFFSWYSNIFSLRFIWIASFWRIVGGGNQVHNAMVFTAIADTHDEKDRADAFFKLLAAILISEITANPLAAGLMQKSAWIPMLLTPLVLFATFLIILFFLPETLPESLRAANLPKSPNGTTSGSKHMTGSMNLGTVGASARTGMDYLLKRRNVVYLLFCFFAATVGRKGMVLLLQFVYKKFGWSLARASFLISLRAFVNLILNLLILPLLSRLLTSARFPFRLSVPRKDLTLSKLAACLLTLGCMTLALCSSVTTLVLGVCLFAMGNPFFLTARSLITSLVPPTHVGVLYTAIGMVSGVGVLIAGPMLAQAFSLGMRMGDNWLGLPYWVAAFLFGLVTVAVWQVMLKKSGVEDARDGTLDEEEAIVMLDRTSERP